MLKKFLSFVIALIILLSTFFQNTLYFQSKAASNLEIYTYSDYAEVYKCNGIGEVIIPSTYRGYTVTAIGSNSFSGAGVSRVVLPDTITRIGYSAFYNCSSLRTIIIPKSVKSIGDYAFQNCYNVTVYYGGTLEDWYKIDMTIQNGNYGLNVIPMSEHDHDGVEILKEPTCTEDGLKRTTCSVCTYTNEEVLPAKHTLGDNVLINAPCEKIGYEMRECIVCGKYVTTKVLMPKGHTYTSIVTAPTCTKQGFTTLTCSKCNDTYISDYVDALGHTNSGFVVEENRIEASCNKSGSYDLVSYCSECKERISCETKEISATGHSYEEVITPPTVTEQGYTTYTCSSCSDSYNDNFVDALGVTLSGIVTSYLSDTDEIIIELAKSGEEEVSYTTIVTGTLTEYSIEAIKPGTYTITVSKSNHTTRNYEITINNNETTQDIKICPIGDANGDGKITVLDYTQLLRHVKKTSTLDGYEFDCADVNGDGKLSVLDYTKLLRHVKKTEMLW